MEKKKGLCSTCVNDSTCCFVRNPVVWQCEEFSEYVSSKPIQEKMPKRINLRQRQEQLEAVYAE